MLQSPVVGEYQQSLRVIVQAPGGSVLRRFKKIGKRFPRIINTLFIRKLTQHVEGFVEE